MFRLKILVWVKAFWRGPPVPRTTSATLVRDRHRHQNFDEFKYRWPLNQLWMQGQQPKPNGTIALEVILLKLIGGGIQQDQQVETDTSQGWAYSYIQAGFTMLCQDCTMRCFMRLRYSTCASQQGHSTLHLLSWLIWAKYFIIESLIRIGMDRKYSQDM